MDMHRQPEAECGEVLMEMPSFRSISGGQEWPPLFLGYLRELDGEGGEAGEEEEEMKFEFASISRDSLDGFEPVHADELFSDGRIRPVYPVFGRALAFDEGDGESKISEVRAGDDGVDGENAEALGRAEESVVLCLSFRDFVTDGGAPLSSSSSSASSFSSSASRESSDELGGVPPESYCVWEPASAPPTPDLRKKSHSTGASSASSKKWRLRNLFPGRSHSDGKERFVFVASPGFTAVEKKDKKKGKKLPPAPAAAGVEKKGKVAGRAGGREASQMDMAAAHQLYYMKGGEADRRRAFLPFRKDLFGLFAPVNAAGRGFRLI